MSTEPTTTATVVDAHVIADTATPVVPAIEPTSAAIETPAVTTEDPVAVEAAPTPTASRSNTTKRLSLLLGKAKTFVDKVSDKKPAKKEATTQVPELNEIVETPVVEEPATTTTETETPAVATTHDVESTQVGAAAAAAAATEEAHAEKPQSDKRKSILGNIFRSKSPVQSKEVEKAEESVPKVVDQVEKPDETVVDKEIQETPAADADATSGAIIEEEPIVATTAKEHKDNVIDSIKKGPLGKFFNKKEKKEQAKEEQPATTEAVEAAETATEQVDEPTTAAETSVAATVEPTATKSSEVNKRSVSPLGRRITQMIRGFSNKKKPSEKKEDPSTAEEPTVEVARAVEADAVEAGAVGASDVEAAKEQEEPVAAQKEQQEEAVVATAATTSVPVVQATA